MDITYIHSTNETNNIPMNDDANVFHRYYEPLLSSNSIEDMSTGTEYD